MLYETIHSRVVLHIHRMQTQVWVSIALFWPCSLNNIQEAQMSPSHSFFWRNLLQYGNVHWWSRWDPRKWSLEARCCLQNKWSALQSRPKESEQDFGNSMLPTILFPGTFQIWAGSSTYIINPICICIDQLSSVPVAGPVTKQERGHRYSSP